VPLSSLAIAQVEVRVEGYCDWQVHAGILDAVERSEAVKAVMLLSRHLDYLEETLLSTGPGLSQNRVAG
jgi:DNA-binding GntR family transcriptional regulator